MTRSGRVVRHCAAAAFASRFHGEGAHGGASGMQAETFRFERAGRRIFVRRWAPDGEAKASVQVAHGLAEHGGRYARLAGALTAAGYVVYASDHRGHGPDCRPDDLGYFADRGGWRACLDELAAVANAIAEWESDIPKAFFGHSMGSFLGQTFIAERGEGLAAVAFSGTTGAPPAIARVGKFLAAFERWRLGPRGKSPIVQSLLFLGFNANFTPARTRFDWLSRDASEVDKYIADSTCGFNVTNSLALDLLDGVATLGSPALAARIPKTLPIYLFRGSRDPVSVNMQGLVDVYRAAGLNDLTVKVYPDARHETLNETNRDEVTADLIAWLDSRTK